VSQSAKEEFKLKKGEDFYKLTICRNLPKRNLNLVVIQQENKQKKGRNLPKRNLNVLVLVRL
jgi:hypothetical protein